jgi:hypothetical protein
MKPKAIYLVLAIAGTVFPYSQLIPFVGEHGLDAGAFVQQAFGTRISAFFTWDVIVSSIALWALVAIDGCRRGMRQLWVPIAANLLVGVSLGLPLFLYMRERQPEATGVA